MGDTDFTGQRVLVVGGSSGIGNGIAHAFKARGATVCVWGTRATREDYAGLEGSDLSGLAYAGVDVGDPDAIDAAPAPFDGLDVLILCQGTVVYNRGEFERKGWDHVMAVNLDSLMHICRRFRPDLAASRAATVATPAASIGQGSRAARSIQATGSAGVRPSPPPSSRAPAPTRPAAAAASTPAPKAMPANRRCRSPAI